MRAERCRRLRAAASPASYARALVSAARRSHATRLPARTVRADGVPVDADRVAAYGRVCSFPLTDRVPATYPHVLALPLQLDLLTAADFPLPALGLVHLRTTAHERRPLRPGDVLDLQVEASRLLAHRKGTAVELRTSGRLSGAGAGRDEPVWSGRSVYMARGVSPAGGAGPYAGRPDRATSPPLRPPAGTCRPTPDAGTPPSAGTSTRSTCPRCWHGRSASLGRSPMVRGPRRGRSPPVQPRLRGAVELDVAFGAPLLLPARVELHLARHDEAAAAAGRRRAPGWTPGTSR